MDFLNNVKKTLIFFLLLFIPFFCANFLFAQEYYWENPERLTSGDCRFPKAVSNENSCAIFWQEIDKSNSTIYLSARIKMANQNGIDSGWIVKNRFAGPFPYSGEVPDLYSVAMNNAGEICVSVLAESNLISVYSSLDGGRTFSRTDFDKTEFPLVAPRVYSLKSDDFVIFTSLGKDESFSILTARSHDATKWSNFTVFTPTQNFTNPFLPVLVSTDKGEVLFFQAQFNSGTRLSYQLMSTRSRNNGVSWSTPELVTGPSSILQTDTEAYTSYHNQRPSILQQDGNLYIAWERNHYASENSQIYFAQIDSSSARIVGSVSRITSSSNASRPILFSYNNSICLTWFDTRQGSENVYFAQKDGALWNEQKLSTSSQSSIFSYPLVSNLGKNLAFVWQTNNAIYRLPADKTVKKPIVEPTTYVLGRRSNNQKVRYKITLPEDSSGVAGYSWIWTNDKTQIPPKTLMALPKDKFIDVQAKDEGQYYFITSATDYAGNWSEPQVISYYRDLTPPPSPKIILPQLDSYGFVDANSFSVMWNYDIEQNLTKDKESIEQDTNDIIGYSWKLEKVDDIEKEYTSSKNHTLNLDDKIIKDKINNLNVIYSKDKLSKLISEPIKQVMQQKSDAQFMNYSNGVYIFSVRAFDQVGNYSQPSYAVMYLNKFEPFTLITSIKKSTDLFGNSNIDLDGQGFTYDGIVSEIYVTKEGSKTPTLKFRYSDGDYKINSDYKISGIKLSTQLERGNYYISLYHTDRGLYNSKIAFSVQDNGTIKIEKYYEYIPSWYRYTKFAKYNVQISYILFAIIMLLTVIGLIFAIRGIVLTIKEYSIVNLQVQAIIKGDIMPSAKKQVVTSLKKKSGGLRLKLIAFTAVLVLMVSLLVSIPLGFIMVQTQERSLSKGLEDRVNVLLESLSSGAKAYMPSENVLELSYLPGQSSALAEANFVTISGFKSNETDFENGSLDYVWASNDSLIVGDNNLIIDTDRFEPGISHITQQDILTISKNCKNINNKAVDIAGEIGNNIAQLNAEGASLALRSDSISVARRNEIADITTELTTKLTESLNKLSIENSSSYPLYDSEKLDYQNTEFLFYRPVLYRSGSSQTYVRAIVFISVSTKSLISELENSTNTISLIAFGIALFAIIVGTICAIILASFIVKPIRKLTKHVQMIGETVDKEKLAGKEISIKSKDEIGQLGDMVNEMTRGLVKAAQDEHLLMDGKVVQQTFLPLGTDSLGNKQTFAQLKDKAIEIFGYYEGASGVSGDYFDYKKLDDRWFVIIKCDVSGHGVPAALLMTVVATLFRKYFENWSFKNKGTDLTSLVCTINDFIEGLGLKGKFATIILSLVDTQTGDVYLCNAGDNIVHIYDSNEKKQKVLTLIEAPAAGPMPTFMVEMKGGFKLEKTHLNKGDILFLYTDGIEESTRKFRDSNFNVMECHEEGLKVGDEHLNHKVGQTIEQLEPERVNAIIEAVLNRKTYVLERYHTADPSERLVFDFSTCEGSVSDAILALASVEKVFRFYKDFEVTKNDLVRVDKQIDLFLKNCFNRYDYYCSQKQEISEESSYLYYTNLREDEQLDDLTLLAVKRS